LRRVGEDCRIITDKKERQLKTAKIAAGLWKADY